VEPNRKSTNKGTEKDGDELEYPMNCPSMQISN